MQAGEALLYLAEDFGAMLAQAGCPFVDRASIATQPYTRTFENEAHSSRFGLVD